MMKAKQKLYCMSLVLIKMQTDHIDALLMKHDLAYIITKASVCILVTEKTPTV